jgi:ankyrin repeat protein
MSGGWSVLMWAADEGQLEIVQALLTNGADVNAKKDSGYTALMIASAKSRPKVVPMLLDHGAEVNFKVSGGQTTGGTALTNAIKCHMVIIEEREVVELLLNHGADINATDNNGVTALSYAASKGDRELVQALLDKGANVNLRSSEFGTALDGAMQYGHADVVEILLQAGATPPLTPPTPAIAAVDHCDNDIDYVRCSQCGRRFPNTLKRKVMEYRCGDCLMR